MIDFGISKIKDLVDNGTVFQFKTNYYSAPEVGQNNENASEKSDIYSVGAVIYYLLTSKEPPEPEMFSQTINTETGINPKIKPILSKMVENKKDDRYENIYDVIADFNNVLTELINTNNTYVYIVPVDMIGTIIRRKLSPRKNYDEMLISEIPGNFQNAYAYVERNEDESYSSGLIGHNYEFKCTYNKEEQLYIVDDVRPISPTIRDKKIKHAYKICGKIIYKKINTQIENNNFELYNTCINTYEDYNSALNINNEYNKKFAAWHKLLEILEDGVKKSAKRFSYKAVSYANNEIILEVDASSYYNLDDIELDCMLIYESKKNNKSIPNEIGCFKNRYIEEDTYFIVLSRTTKMNIQLPERGVLCEDYRRNLALIKREKNSLREFNTSDVSTIANIKGILSEVKNAKSFNLNQDIEYFNEKLDKFQQSAVEKVLKSQDIALIQGPPGTGKTNVIIEIIRQIIKINNQGKTFQQKILILSQAHTAVDNMLEDLSMCDIDDTQIIRIGKDEKLTELVRNKYAVDYAKERWIKSIIEKSTLKIVEVLNKLSVSEDDFYAYFDAMSKNKGTNASSKEKDRHTKIIDAFECKYPEQIKHKDN